MPITLSQLLTEHEAPDWFGALPRQREAPQDFYVRPSPPSRELPFGGTAYLPEEFLYQYHEAPRAQEPETGRLPTLEDLPRVPGPVEDGVELPMPRGSEGRRQYLELPGMRIPVGQFAENPGHHLRHILDPFIATWGLGTAGAEAAAGLNTLSRMLGRFNQGRGDSKIEALREAPAHFEAGATGKSAAAELARQVPDYVPRPLGESDNLEDLRARPGSSTYWEQPPPIGGRITEKSFLDYLLNVGRGKYSALPPSAPNTRHPPADDLLPGPR